MRARTERELAALHVEESGRVYDVGSNDYVDWSVCAHCGEQWPCGVARLLTRLAALRKRRLETGDAVRRAVRDWAVSAATNERLVDDWVRGWLAREREGRS